MTQRLRAALGALVFGLLALLGTVVANPASAAGDAIVGTLTGPDGTPVTGVEISVTSPEFTGSATTDAEGYFRVDLPAGGTYDIEIDVTTLPAGISLERPDDAEEDLLRSAPL